MRNLTIKFLGLAIMAMPLFTSCNDDEEVTSETVKSLETGTMSGSLEEDYTLDASTTYSLTGSFTIEDGATLTIPAGTQIVATAGGTEVFIAVMMGGKINIEGTADSPVVMSSTDAEPGDWGGLTICGKGVTSAGTDIEAEVGGFIYGGTDNTDNSGSIEYLVIKGTGAQIDSESQYNGVSFYAVGSGTTVSNVAVINGSDDGVEFFGGDVDVTNLFLQNNEDDAIDWTEGWSGSVTNAYIEHTVDFSTAFEGDKVNNNPTFTNITCVSTVGGTALQFKKESGGTITGLSLTGYDVTIDMKDDGPLENVIIEGETADPEKSYNAEATVDVSTWTWVEAGVEVETWSGSTLIGEVDGIITLDASVSYSLTGALTVEEGGSLIIPAGTQITAEAGGTEVFIAVMMGGKIYINGTADAPVVMSSTNASPGDWGGLTICGRATTSAGTNVEAEVGGFIYGGESDDDVDDDDNSGSVEYLIIKGTGAQIDSESQYNGVSLYAVGSSTNLANIAVINGSDDGIEFFGGTATVTNMYVEDCEDDAIDWTEGWSGGITNTYIIHNISDFSTVFEGDKVNNNPVFTNVTAVSTTGGTGLQFKKESGATITGLYISGYDVELDMKDAGPTSNIIVEGAAADVTLIDGETSKYTFNSGIQSAATVAASEFSWVD